MATAKAYGMLTIVDITDIGEFSVYPMSNLPLSVVYTPDQQNYAPDWGTNNLILTPVVYYAGKALTLGTQGLSIEWSKMSGISSVGMTATEVTGGTGILNVSANQFSENSAPITYTVTASYIEPSSKQTLTAQGQITFTLIKMASEVRDISISGNNIFKYDTNGVVNINSTTLTATTANVTVSDWEYYNGSSWSSLGNSSVTYTLSHNAEIFSNDSVQIRVKAYDNINNESLYYDYITVVRLRDGAAGDGTVAMVISNEDQFIPCNSSGVPSTTGFDLAYTSVIMYEGGKDVTSEYTIKAKPNGVIGAWTSSETVKPTGTSNETSKGTNLFYWVTGWNASNGSDIGYVDFVATKGSVTIKKTMSLTKLTTGKDGVSPTVYLLELDSLQTNRQFTYSSNNTVSSTTYSVNSITAKAYSVVGTTKTAYSGNIRVYLDGSSSATINTSIGTNGYTFSGIGSTYSPTKLIKFELYDGSAVGATLLDTQTVVVTSDGIKGQTGQTGETGKSAVNLILGNYADTISVNASYKPYAQTRLTIPFAAYYGISKIGCTITAANAAISMNGKTYTPTVTTATSARDGSLVYTIPSTDVIGTSSSTGGTKSLTFTYTLPDNTTGTVTATYTWALSVSGTSGENAIILQVSTPSGYIFLNGDGNLTIKASLINGANVQTSNVTYQWSKFSSGNYTNITSTNNNGESGYTSDTLTVPGTSVDSYASYRCAATYNSKTYYGYASLIDKTDPLQCEILSTVGTQIVNGQGIGAVYVKVLRDGKEIDELKTERFLTTAPTEKVTGDYYYHLDSKNKTVKLMKWTGSAWSEVTNANELPKGTYKWSYRDYNNNVVTTGTPASLGKVIYVDADLINKKLTFDVEVEI